ncbi:DNA cytosine methyltransferase [Burkholderia pseudomallei]|uniref:DNA cytosine methyltransferase n=1 Tax=Burkholderia pseudomallei TaxID=28450 RepID=UPI000F096F05|nr:DNA cytosine methyltransferase [Burkholderia pseudomallei]CAJ3080606.1 DNA-cytosine methyltransferase [Burkholderia pseudomallei]VCK80325.1 DNA-cytosine methyltransferase [Burkholderia pseudomallei]VCK83524.1 DNA-cytosine methyltransferase [Burkholderia pseudomallei]VCK91501.1 DNA-cytosine methyltransferase [Burkholderia pseudomallei]VCK96805.1 DNA-cytosine methyltransferase [Burkholderia pseudomallei]
MAPASASCGPSARSRRPYLEFFAGSGLVAEGLRSFFRPVWANDLSEKKAKTYIANHGARHFQLGSVEDVRGRDLPAAALAWASFPCQDLSLAGKQAGIQAARSGLVWSWLRVLDEMPDKPEVLVAENVVGLVSSQGGLGYRLLHAALRARGYVVGAVRLDAARWLPQSRPRVFVVAYRDGLPLPADLVAAGPTWAHDTALIRAQRGLAADGLDGWVWWALPEPRARVAQLANVLEPNASWSDPASPPAAMALVAPAHEARLRAAAQASSTGEAVAAGFRRTRPGGQVVELRFDGLAGCLRTPKGGSSRQLVVRAMQRGAGALQCRWISPREAARLMGAPDHYAIIGADSDGLAAMGDAVAVPVAKWLGRHLLATLARSAKSSA